VRGATRLFGSPPAIAAALRARIVEEEGLTSSVGVARTKFLAKLASEAAKPRATPTGPVFGEGVKVVQPADELAFLHPLPARALWGVGPATQKVLDRLGIATVGDIAGFDEATLVTALGDAHGRHLWRLANAIDDRPVVPDQRVKSVSHEETFATDRTTNEALRPEVVRMADAVADRLRRLHLGGRTVTIKVRFHDFRTITRSVTLDGPVDSGPAVARAAKELLSHVDPASGVRLLGVGVTNLVEGAAVQLQLGEGDGEGPAAGDRWDGASTAVDAIRARFGTDAVLPATVVHRGSKRPGEQQWGPSGSE
jgi:DNA polymerase-4